MTTDNWVTMTDNQVTMTDNQVTLIDNPRVCPQALVFVSVITGECEVSVVVISSQFLLCDKTLTPQPSRSKLPSLGLTMVTIAQGNFATTATTHQSDPVLGDFLIRALSSSSSPAYQYIQLIIIQ